MGLVERDKEQSMSRWNYGLWRNHQLPEVLIVHGWLNGLHQITEFVCGSGSMTILYMMLLAGCMGYVKCSNMYYYCWELTVFDLTQTVRRGARG